MKKLTLILLLIGLFSSFAYASTEQEPNEVIEKNDIAVTQENIEAGEKEIIEESDVVEPVKEEVVILTEEPKTEEVREEPKPSEKPNFLISETAMYYTFSTIAQTLAGAFGILGAFTMYRLCQYPIL